MTRTMKRVLSKIIRKMIYSFFKGKSNLASITVFINEETDDFTKRRFFKVLSERKFGNIYKITDFYIPGTKAANKLVNRFLMKFIGQLQILSKRYL